MDPVQTDADRLRAEIQQVLGVTRLPVPSGQTAPGTPAGRFP
jgi:hypothetical protein